MTDQNKANDQDIDQLNDFDWAWIYSVAVGLLSLIGVMTLFSITNLGESKAIRGAGMLAIPCFVYWLIWHKSGPGVEGVNRLMRKVLGPILRAPEDLRLKIAWPVLSACLLAAAVTAGYLIVSDEASQKRALYGSYDSDRTVLWSHGGDQINVWVDSLVVESNHTTKDNPDKKALVHFQYTGEILDERGNNFRERLESDLDAASRAQLNKLSVDGEIGLYSEVPGPFSSISYHGAFGFTGVGLLETIMLATVILVSFLKALVGHMSSFSMVGMASFVVVLCLPTWTFSQTQIAPVLVQMLVP